MISAEQMERVLGYIEKGRAEGGEVLAGGGRALYDGEERGFWVQPRCSTRSPRTTASRARRSSAPCCPS
jgi:acyl-CoA reductase-like NAD-dependent aldehyde dehydrogenase